MKKKQKELNLEDTQTETIDIGKYEFEPIQGYPMLNWRGKRPFKSTQYYPAQPKETYGPEIDNWKNKIYWGDNLQVMGHLLKNYRGKIKLIYVDPPFDSKADYRREIKLRGNSVKNDGTSFEEKQYSDMWAKDEYLQFMYERLILMKELLSDDGGIYLHCDYRKAHHLRCLLDEIFGEDNFLNSIVWQFSTRSSIKTSWKRTHHDILFYKKSANPIYNWSDEMVIEPLSENTIKKYKYEDEVGRYRLSGRFLKDSPIKGAKDVDPKWEKTHPELVVRDYLREGKVAGDCFFIDIENQASSLRTDYPTQKPEELLYKLISASSNPGDIIFDCFMGSGTTQAAAMKLGRRFIGADINLGSLQTTTKRLIGILNTENKKQIDIENSEDQQVSPYLGFEVYNVNHYDIFKNPLEAKDLIIEALEIQKMQANNLYDGEKEGRMVKIMPVNRIATRADLNELVTGFNYKAFERRQTENPNKPVEKLLIICMGHEADLAAVLQNEVNYKLDIEVVDILRDKSNLEFKRDSEAKIIVKSKKLIIKQFYPMNLLQKLSLLKENVEDWRELVESVMVDWNYDGGVLEPSVVDLPAKDELVKGEYSIPKDVGTIRVKITDLLSESLEVEVKNG